MPLSAKSPNDSTVMSFSTAIDTRGLIRICPGLASSQSRERDIGDRSDGGVIEASLKADSAEGGKSMRNPNAKANVVAKLTPLLN